MNPTTPAQTLKESLAAMKAELASCEKIIQECRYELRQHRQGNVAGELLGKLQRTVDETLASPEWRELDHGLDRRQNRTAETERRLQAAIAKRDKLRAEARAAGVLI
jgi:hypothetical protein